ncbi:hypothetical protein TNCV_10831 [Trichonephila clavipes]|nr:hypothetical protein TNCV_10831 [Trichonephila clavipes]
MSLEIDNGTRSLVPCSILSPIWCSRPRPTTGVLLARCHDEFRGPRSDYVRQIRNAKKIVEPNDKDNDNDKDTPI